MLQDWILRRLLAPYLTRHCPLHVLAPKTDGQNIQRKNTDPIYLTYNRPTTTDHVNESSGER
jgi:hypothetical protein